MSGIDMRDFLSDFVNSLTAKRQKTIYSILADATVAKSDIDSIAKRLMEMPRSAPLVFNGEGFGTRIRFDFVSHINREMTTRFHDLYRNSNDISLLLDTYATILMSEIKGLEDEIAAIEKAIDNYGFTLSDGGFYDYAFTEPFNDDTMREDSSNVVLSDRSGTDFSAEETASVNYNTGVLTLNAGVAYSVLLSGTTLKSNCSSFIASDTGLSSALNDSTSSGWRVSISSPRPITSTIYSPFEQGAQFELEFTLQFGTPVNTLSITPFADLPVRIANITLFETLDQSPSDAKVILGPPILLDRPQDIEFPMQTVAKFRMVVNQPVYSRGTTPPNAVESTYKVVYDNVKIQRKKSADFIPFKKNKEALRMVFLETFGKITKAERKMFKAQVPQLDFHARRGPLTTDKILTMQRSSLRKDQVWHGKSPLNEFIRRMAHEKMFASNNQILNDRHIYGFSRFTQAGRSSLDQTMSSMMSQEFPRIEALEPQGDMSILVSPTMEAQGGTLDYNYNLGFRNIQLGTGIKTFRGVFVSKPIPAPGDSLEIKLKADDINYEITDTSRDSPNITSIEYSISNKSFPQNENDWVPIMPVDDELVKIERLFVDNSGLAMLRFLAAPYSQFAIYKNGYDVDLDTVTLIPAANTDAIGSLRLAQGSFLSSDIFTISYKTYRDERIINLADRGISQATLSSAYDETGAGETFSQTRADRVVVLANDPYIDYALVNESGSYTLQYGFEGTYQPIMVIMEDGTVAMNHTNYLNNTQNSLTLFGDSETAYVHSGRYLIFNRDITDKFTVYYQYRPSNLRMRVVMRVNDVNHVSPIVNSVQVKTKTKKANARGRF